MATGDLSNNIGKLKTKLKLIKYTEEVNVNSLAEGSATAYLPVYHYAFTSYSPALAEQILGKDIELYGKSDTRFMESVYKVLRDFFSYKPPIYKDQFFSRGFAERKVIMCTEILQLVKDKATELNPGAAKSILKTRVRSKSAEVPAGVKHAAPGCQRGKRPASSKQSSKQDSQSSSSVSPRLAPHVVNELKSETGNQQPVRHVSHSQQRTSTRVRHVARQGSGDGRHSNTGRSLLEQDDGSRPGIVRHVAIRSPPDEARYQADDLSPVHLKPVCMCLNTPSIARVCPDAVEVVSMPKEVVDDDVGEFTGRAVPITSYSSSEDEEFFDADEERSPKSSPDKRRGVKSQDSSVFEEAEEQAENTESRSEDKLDVETAETTADQLVPKVASPAPAQSEWDYFYDYQKMQFSRHLTDYSNDSGISFDFGPYRSNSQPALTDYSNDTGGGYRSNAPHNVDYSSDSGRGHVSRHLTDYSSDSGMSYRHQRRKSVEFEMQSPVLSRKERMASANEDLFSSPVNVRPSEYQRMRDNIHQRRKSVEFEMLSPVLSRKERMASANEDLFSSPVNVRPSEYQRISQDLEYRNAQLRTQVANQKLQKEAEIEELEIRMGGVENEVLELRAALKKSQHNLAETQDKKEETAKTHQTLQGKLSELKELQESHQVLKEQQNELSSNHTETLTQLKDTQKNLQLTQTALEEHKKELTELHEKHNKVTNDLTESVNENSRLKEELDSVKREKDDTNEKLQAATLEINQLKGDFTDLDVKLKSSDSGFEELRQKYNELQETQNKTVIDLQNCKQELVSTVLQLEHSKSDCDKLKDELEAGDKHKSELADTKTKLTHIEDQLQHRNTELGDVKGKLSECKNNLTTSKQELDSLKEKLTGKETELNEVKTQLDDIQQKLAGVTDELNKAMEREKELNNSFFDELSEFVDKNQDLKDENLILKDQIKQHEAMSADETRWFVSEMSICFSELQSVVQIIVQMAEGKQPDISLLLGMADTTLEEEQGGVGGAKKDNTTPEHWFKKLKELRLEAQKIRMMLCDKCASEVADKLCSTVI